MINRYAESVDPRVEIDLRVEIDPRVQLRHLRYFRAVGEELHFGRAAQRLGIAQPPLSQQIKRLETLLGLKLFERSSRRVALTDAGRTLMDQSLLVFAAMKEATESTRRAAAGEIGTVRVTFTESVMFEGLPDLVREFRAQYPMVRLELRELSTGAQIAALHSGELDVGFVRDPADDPSFLVETIVQEPLLVAMSETHPLAPRDSIIDLGQLASEDFVLFPREVAPGLFDQVMALCRTAGFAPNVVQESREVPTTVSLVEAGIGVTILPASISRWKWRGVVYCTMAGIQPTTPVVMVSRRDNQRSVVASFLGVARTLVAGAASPDS